MIAASVSLWVSGATAHVTWSVSGVNSALLGTNVPLISGQTFLASGNRFVSGEAAFPAVALSGLAFGKSGVLGWGFGGSWVIKSLPLTIGADLVRVVVS